MSVIAIVISGYMISAPALLKLQKTLQVPLFTIRAACEKRLPIVEEEVFDGDYQAKSHIIRAVLQIIEGEGISAQCYEIPYGEGFAGNQSLETWKVSKEFVLDMLRAADEEVERQLDS